MQKSFKNMIKEICNEDNIKYNLLSKDWIIMLEKDEKTRFISGYKFDSNLHALGLIADDKYAMYDVLATKGICVAKHSIVYRPNNKNSYAEGCNTYKYVKEYFFNNNEHIVIKPNNGSCGNGVYNITDANMIDNILDELFTSNYSVSICPFYRIKYEYRVVMLDGECELLYAKCLPSVVGDGHRTIRELLIDFNYDFFVDKLYETKYDRILNKHEKFEYNWKFNLQQGSIAKKVSNPKLKDELVKIAQNVCNVTNLNFGSVDIIQTENDKLLVLEVNSGIMLENYVRLNPDEYGKVKNMYRKAIHKLFKN